MKRSCRPDWISNLALINPYDMRSGEFFYINRAYVNHRKSYQAVLKEAKEHFDPNDKLLSRMDMHMDDALRNFEGIKARIEFGKLLPFSRRENLDVEKSAATREGEPASGSQLVQGYTVAKMAALTSTDACGFQRRGRNAQGGGNWNKGQGRYGFDLQFKDISYCQIQDTPQVQCRHPICGYLMIDGHLKCPQCFRQMEPVTDANIATEVARREASARTRGVPFSMDKVIFNHPRRGRNLKEGLLHHRQFEPEARMETCETWHATMSDLSRNVASRRWSTDCVETHSFSSMRRTKIWCPKPSNSSNGWLAV